MNDRFMKNLAVASALAGLIIIGGMNIAQAGLKVPSFFSENMVLQRDVPVPLWGWAEDGEPISIIYGDHQLKTVAEDGRWRVELPAMPAGGPHTLAIQGRNPNDTLLFSQVMVGEVWIVCGQSNALLPLHNVDDYEEALANRQNYPLIREAQLQTWRSVPHTGMAVTLDIGDPYDIHPRRKLPVAERLFLQARRLVYGETDVIADSPHPEEVAFADGASRIRFGGAGGGLVAQGDALQGFELSADGIIFSSVTAEIDGDTVIVSSAEVATPVAVRYAWAGWPEATLRNREGLPATPFRYPIPDGN